MRLRDLANQPVIIWGAGREASAFVRAVKATGVPMDIAIYDEFAAQDGAAQVEGVPVLGVEHGRMALDQAAVVVLSPGISRYRPEVAALTAAGKTVTTATNLWFGEDHERVIAVTGTKGKSTTASLIAHLLTATGRRAQLAGNIGQSPIDFLGDRSPDWWVLELSSFQTAGLDRSPNIGVLTTLSPEHLDWHGDFDHYRDDKLNLFAHNPDIVTVANIDDPGVAEVTDRLINMVPVGVDPEQFPHCVSITGENFTLGPTVLFPTSALRLVGRHNLRLACLALTAIAHAGVDLVAEAASLSSALFSFEPLPHRLSPVGTYNGVTFIDDGLATTPIATMAAVDAFAHQPVTLLAGGHDRGVSYDELGTFLAARGSHVTVITMPANGERIATAIGQARDEAHMNAPAIHRSASLDEAVAMAADLTPSGGVVLLSPAAASFGAFRDYVERSEAFVRAVTSLYEANPQ